MGRVAQSCEGEGENPTVHVRGEGRAELHEDGGPGAADARGVPGPRRRGLFDLQRVRGAGRALLRARAVLQSVQVHCFLLIFIINLSRF